MCCPSIPSLPTRERGLKLLPQRCFEGGFSVAPYAGAWIEIKLNDIINWMRAVAPYAGAWIEMTLEIFVVVRESVGPDAGAGIEIR